MQIILEAQRSGLSVLGAFVGAAIVRGTYRGLKQRRANLATLARMRAALAAQERWYGPQRPGSERSTDE